MAKRNEKFVAMKQQMVAGMMFRNSLGKLYLLVDCGEEVKALVCLSTMEVACTGFLPQLFKFMDKEDLFPAQPLKITLSSNLKSINKPSMDKNYQMLLQFDAPDYNEFNNLPSNVVAFPFGRGKVC